MGDLKDRQEIEEWEEHTIDADVLLQQIRVVNDALLAGLAEMEKRGNFVRITGSYDTRDAGIATLYEVDHIVPKSMADVLLMSDAKTIQQPASRIKAPPGHRIMVVAEFLFSRHTYEEVFVAAINDMRFEHAEALAAGRLRKARWIHTRGVAGVLLAAMGVTLGDVIQRVLRAYRSVVG